MSKNRPTIQNKEESTEMNMADSSGIDLFDQLAVPAYLKKQIEEKGLVMRWVNAHKLAANHGFDSRYWTPYRVENAPAGPFSGIDSEGYMRRGDLILAVQTKQVNRQRKALVDARNQRNKGHNKEAADTLRQAMGQAGIKAKITEGYDEN